jgi:glucose-1-phosphate adenylyltransferase
LICELLDNPLSDFGKHIIPHAINSRRVFSHIFEGYWADIGTIRSFFEANLDLVSELPRFNFFDMSAPIFSRPRYLPGSKINGAQIEHAVISDGCIINHALIKNTIIGLRTVVGSGTEMNRVITLGSDYYESEESISKHERQGKPRIGIGENCKIENAIIDKNTRIGNNVKISPAGKPENVDHDLYFIRDGIVVIPKNATIPHGTVI